MALTRTTHTVVIDETDSVVEDERAVEKLYTLQELKDGKHIEDEPDGIITRDVSGAYDRAREKLSEWNTEYEWWDTVLDDIAEVYGACGIEIKGEDIEFDLDRARSFVVPETYVDTNKFLKALKVYLSGVDIRTVLLDYGDTEGNRKNAIKAIGTQIRKLDLRSKDVRIVKEQGVKVHRIQSSYSSRNDPQLDEYYYDGLSEAFQEDANEFISDLAHYGLKALDEELEYRYSEEALLEMADANDYRFTKTGELA